MASDALELPPNLAGRLRRVGEMLIGLSGSPVPTHLFQTLAAQAQAVVPHDYLAVCLGRRCPRRAASRPTASGASASCAARRT
jgi:hypothetical protein